MPRYPKLPIYARWPCGPDEGLGAAIVLVAVLLDGADEVVDIAEGAPLERLGGQVPKEPFDPVQPRGAGGREVEMEPWIPFLPSLYLRMRVRAVVVADQMYLLVARHLRLEQLEKLEPLLMTVACMTLADDRALQDIQRGEQRGRAVAFVVVRHRPAATPLPRQPGLRAIQRLNPALLLTRQHEGMLRRRPVQTHDVLQFLHELRILGQLERLDQVRLETLFPPEASNRGGTQSRRRGHRRAAPVRPALGRFTQRFANHGGTLRVLDPPPSPRTWRVLLNSGQTTLGVACAPASRLLPRDAQRRRDVLIFQAVRCQPHHRRAFGQSDRDTPPSLEFLQTTTLGLLQGNGHCFSHEIQYAQQGHMFYCIWRRPLVLRMAVAFSRIVMTGSMNLSIGHLFL